MTQSNSTPRRSFVADSLATGMLIMLVMTVVQRGVGFARGIWFCRLLDDARLGQWSMAYDFVVLVTPIMLLGLPGSLPRYVESYRQQGHLAALVRRLLIATALLGGLFFLLLMTMQRSFGWLIFSDPSAAALVSSVARCAVVFVAFGFINQLVSGLRQVRVVSMMQFVQSIAFTALGVLWLSAGGGVAGLIDSFTLATLLAMVPGVISLKTGWQGLPRSSSPLDAGSMWRRLLPYAAALWVMNLLINVFSLTDRYMILHLIPGGESHGQAAIGQYHSSWIIPTVLISLAMMVSGVLMPYLSADWEQGSQERVRQRLREVLFVIATAFTLIAAVSLLVAPWLFTQLLEGRYAAGLSLMPMSLVIAIWFALGTVGQDYLWVAERGKLVAFAIAVGLVVNIALNLILLPRFGLPGAVLATLIANGVMLTGIWIAMARCGYPFELGSCFLTLLPATLLAGPWVSIILVACTAAIRPELRGWLALLRQRIEATPREPLQSVV